MKKDGRAWKQAEKEGRHIYGDGALLAVTGRQMGVPVIAGRRGDPGTDGDDLVYPLPRALMAAKFCSRPIPPADGRVVADGAPPGVITVENLEQAYGLVIGCRAGTAGRQTARAAREIKHS